MGKIIYKKSEQHKVKHMLASFQESTEYGLYQKYANYVQDAYYFNAASQYGSDHTKRVLYLALVQCMYEPLTEKERELLIYTCIYHDIGRVDYNRDPLHGKKGWEKLIQTDVYPLLLQSTFTEDELELIKYLITAHSLEDVQAIELLDETDILDKSLAINLLKRLKDADALDLVRFNFLNANYLRTDEAKKMVDIAIALYKNKIDYKNIDVCMASSFLVSCENFQPTVNFTEDNLILKVKELTKKVGANVLYPIGLLYHLYMSPNVNGINKTKIVSIFGYLLSPIDMIPDLLAMGLADDTFAMLMLLQNLIKDIDEDIKTDAKNWVKKWLPSVSDEDFKITDSIIDGADFLIPIVGIFSKKNSKKKSSKGTA